MSRRPIESRIDTGGDGPHEGPGVSPDRFREAFSHWAATVAVVAVRDDDRVYATTATSFVPVSAEPPRVLVSLGPGAQVLPFVDPGGVFAVSLLARDQRRLATDFADPFPVGPPPFPDTGPPLVEGAVVGLTCRAEEVVPVDGNRLVVARVEAAEVDGDREPLLYYRHEYGSVG